MLFSNLHKITEYSLRMQKCANCGNEGNGNFCSQCGQSRKVGRINAHYIFHDLPSTFFQLDKGFFFTVKQLATQPAQSIKDFIQGKRKPYTKPLAFALITSTIYFLLSHWLGFNNFFEDALSGFKSANSDRIGSNYMTDFLEFIIQYSSYFILLLAPIAALASLIAFKKAKYNYFEHLVLNLYIFGIQYLLSTITTPLFSSFYYLEGLPFLLAVIYNIWVFYTYFNKDKPVKRVLNIFFYYALFYFILSGILISITGVSMLFNPK